jgi:outer membrane protein TolC
MLLKAYTMLHELLGARVSIDAIPLLDHLQPQPITQSLFELESYALTTHPRILMEQATIARAHHAISYEKSRIFDDVEIGLAYERELEKGKSGIGPALSLTIPFFDLNYGNIEHAKFELKQAEKMLCAHQRELHKQLLVHYSLYQSYCKQIAEYETTVLPAAAQAIEYSKTFSDRMQINTLILLETEIGFYEQKMKLAELTHQSIIHYIDLEQTVGAALVRLQTSEVV